MPDKKRYRPGEEIDLSGLRVAWRTPANPDNPNATIDKRTGEAYVDLDVSSEALTSVEEGSSWRAADKKVRVEVAWEDPDGATQRGAFFELRRKRRLLPLLLALLVVAAVAGVAGYFAYQAYLASLPNSETGSRIIPQGDMTDDEVRDLLDEQAERSRFTVSVRPSPELYEGMLHVNFVVEEPNNGFSERLEIEQGGNVVASTGVVAPGYMVEWVAAPQAAVGPATATVYALDADGRDTGNPASVEVEVVQGTEGP